MPNATLVIASLALLGAACSDTGTSSESPDKPGPEVNDAGKPSRDAGETHPEMPAADTAQASPHCEEPAGFSEPSDPVTVEFLSARVVDQDGEPAVDLLAQACGLNLCINASTGEDGAVEIMPGEELVKPAFKYGSGIRYAKLAIPLRDDEDFALGEVGTVRFPDEGKGEPMLPGQVMTSSGVELSLSASTDVDVDLLTYGTPELSRFRAARVAPEIAAGFEEEELELVYATTPVETEFCPPAGFSVPNKEEWPAGTQVEFLVHGVSITETWAPYGGWAVVSSGAVSADGKRVETATGEGLPVLSVIGIRRKSR